MKRTGKTATLVTGVAMTMVLAVAGIVGKNWIVEEWNIHKLESGDEQEVKAAARILGEFRSQRAVPHLVRQLSNWTEEGKGSLIPEFYEDGDRILKDYCVVTGTWKFNQDVKDALLRIGGPAVPALLAALKNENEDGSKCGIVRTLGETGSAAISAVSELEWVGRHASDENLRRMARDALAKIQGH